MWQTDPSSISLKTTPSLVYNNLTWGIGQTAFIHKTAAFFLNDAVQTIRVQSKDNSYVMSVQYCGLKERTVLVLATMSNVQVWDTSKGTGELLFVFDTPKDSVSKDETQAFHFRGVGAFEQGSRNSFVVGSASGDVFIFQEVSPRAFTCKGKASHHSAPICSASGLVASTDETGRICVWRIDDMVKVGEYSAGDGHNCVSVRFYSDYLVAGYANGLIRIWDTKSGNIAIEISAHARSITAIDIHATKPWLATCGEDCMLEVWELPTAGNGETVKLVWGTQVTNKILSGVKFINDNIATAAYDYESMLIYQKQ